jgi:hypothetical protein
LPERNPATHHYKLLQQIGEGGGGVVSWLTGRAGAPPVALKIIKPGMDTKSVIARLKRSGGTALSTPNIAKIFDAGATSPVGRSDGTRACTKITDTATFIDDTAAAEAICAGLPRRPARAPKESSSGHQAVQHTGPRRTMPVVIDFESPRPPRTVLTDKTLFTAFEMPSGRPL